MTGELRRERETMHNIALGAQALWAFSAGFADTSGHERSASLWHVYTVLPLVWSHKSRTIILKRQVASGLRTILNRDIDLDLAQNEAIFGLEQSMLNLRERTARALNCGLAWRLVALEQGGIVPARHFSISSMLEGEAKDIVRSSEKLGKWAGQLSAFEYLTILGVGPKNEVRYPPTSPVAA